MSAASKGEVKIEQKSRQDSSDSKEEQVKCCNKWNSMNNEWQKKTKLIMDVVNTRLYAWFKIGESKFSATHLMIFLYERCYGHKDSAMQWQRKKMESRKRLGYLQKQAKHQPTSCKERISDWIRSRSTSRRNITKSHIWQWKLLAERMSKRK